MPKNPTLDSFASKHAFVKRTARSLWGLGAMFVHKPKQNELQPDAEKTKPDVISKEKKIISDSDAVSSLHHVLGDGWP